MIWHDSFVESFVWFLQRLVFLLSCVSRGGRRLNSMGALNRNPITDFDWQGIALAAWKRFQATVLCISDQSICWWYVVCPNMDGKFRHKSLFLLFWRFREAFFKRNRDSRDVLWAGYCSRSYSLRHDSIGWLIYGKFGWFGASIGGLLARQGFFVEGRRRSWHGTIVKSRFSQFSLRPTTSTRDWGPRHNKKPQTKKYMYRHLD